MKRARGELLGTLDAVGAAGAACAAEARGAADALRALGAAAALAFCLGGCGGGSEEAGAGSGGSAANGGSAASGGGAASGGSAASGGGAASGGSVGATCEANQVKLAYDGGAEQTYEIKGWPTLYGGPNGMRRLGGRLGPAQYEIAFTPQTDAANPMLPELILDTQPWPVERALWADATEEALGPVRCVSPGSGSTLARQGDQLLLDFKNVDVMAACGDRAVEGQINLCFEFGGCPLDFDGGSVAGTPWVLQPDTWVGGLGSWRVDFNEGSYMVGRTTSSTTGPAYWALIVTSESGPYGGEVFCASGGSVEESDDDFGYTIQHWTNLGQLSCGAGTGSAKGCLKGE